MWKPIIVVVDEADFFFPQQGESCALEAGLDVNGRGRKRGYRMILTTRRISKLHKDIADVQNRMIGMTGLDLDVKRAGDELGMDKEGRKTLPLLAPGTFYVYGPAISTTPVLARTGAIQTTHPQAGRIGAVAPPAPTKIRALISQFADLPKEALEEARSIEDLRRENAELGRQLRAVQRQTTAGPVAATPVVDQQAIARAVARALTAERKDVARRLTLSLKDVRGIVQRLSAVSGVVSDLTGVGAALQAMTDYSADSRAEVQVGNERGSAREATNGSSALPATGAINTADSAVGRNSRAPARPIVTPSTITDGLTAVQQRILNALAAFTHLGVEPTRVQLAFQSGYGNPTSPAFRNPLGALRTGGYLEYGDGTVVPTEAGRMAGVRTPINSLAELQAFWLERLKPVERRIMQALLPHHRTGGLTRVALAESSGYTNPTSPAFRNPLGHLRTLGLIEYGRDGQVFTTDVLFPEGLR